MLRRTIADVCVAHGLMHYELEDRERYPVRRDIRDYAVNVRLLAILLRLGDLLDMTSDRACPLLLNAANPLPADSLAHWTQYQRIMHRATTPDLIEITAECLNQEEHRVLQDWCQWIVNEVAQARILMGRADLHQSWQPPEATLSGHNPTIVVRRAPDAAYFPSDWTFNVDEDAVLRLLIKDVYSNPLVFVRELIQNALDANRCQMYADLVRDRLPVPEYPTQVEEERRRRYPVKLSLEARRVRNELSGEEEERQVFTIEDSGLGMNEEIIENYFLQVGRSFYITDEFRRSFRFVPTSRFGVGFLSTFAVSDRIVVETFKPGHMKYGKPVRLTLTGPRNYLLTELGDRRSNGTRIEVELREPMDKGKLTELVTEWCKRVEFPVYVDDLGQSAVVVAERPEEFLDETSDLSTSGAKFAIRAFPMERAGIEGEIYIFMRVDEGGEAWGGAGFDRYSYGKQHPLAIVPRVPDNLICLHGISIEKEDEGPASRSVRLDYRGNKYLPTLSRGDYQQQGHYAAFTPEINSRMEEILREHLATSPRSNSGEGWKYRQALVTSFPLISFWSSVPEMLPIRKDGRAELVRLTDIHGWKTLTSLRATKDEGEYSYLTEDQISSVELSGPLLIDSDFVHVSTYQRAAIFDGRAATNIRWLMPGCLAIDWSCDVPDNIFYHEPYVGKFWLVEVPDLSLLGFHDLFSSSYMLNVHHPHVQWLMKVKSYCHKGEYGFSEQQFYVLMSEFSRPIRFPSYYCQSLNSYLKAWIKVPDLPADAYPPAEEVTPEMLTLKVQE